VRENPSLLGNAPCSLRPSVTTTHGSGSCAKLYSTLKSEQATIKKNVDEFVMRYPVRG